MNTKDIKIDFSKLERNNRHTSWQKAVFGAVIISVFVYLVATGYLFFRPISKDIEAIIDQEISSSNITFDKKTLLMLKSRQIPPANTQTQSGKNPFTPF